MQYILLDIEGTTTSISFVYEVLFPYFIEHIAFFLADHTEGDRLQDLIDPVRETVFREEGKRVCANEITSLLISWTRQDRKYPALKAIQGAVWKQGYESGQIRGHVYDDVLPALEKWANQGLSIGIYSSGSVDAQKLLFRYSACGDMTFLLSDYFDTAIGHKQETASYNKISQKLGIPAREILFLSDAGAELDAAGAAGYTVIQLVRAAGAPVNKHRMVHDFSEINIEGL